MTNRLLLATVLFAVASSAQAALVSLDEGFDDISTLPGAGWVMANNSSPIGTTGWFQGNPGVFAAFDGAADAYIAANFENAAAGGAISNWLITPELAFPDQADGAFNFFTRSNGAVSGFFDYLEIRIHTSTTEGGTSTDVGGAFDSVGDFTALIGTIGTGGTYPSDWQGFGVAGTNTSGVDVYLRLAFRYVVPNTETEGDYIGIDSVHWSTSVTPPPPVPEPGTLALLGMGLALAAARARRAANAVKLMTD